MVGQLLGNVYPQLPDSAQFLHEAHNHPELGPILQHILANSAPDPQTQQVMGSPQFGGPVFQPGPSVSPGIVAPAMAPPQQPQDNQFEQLIRSMSHPIPNDPGAIAAAYKHAADLRTQAAGIPNPTPGNGLMRPGTAALVGLGAALAQGLSGKYAGPVGEQIVQGAQQGAQAKQAQQYQAALNQANAQRGTLQAQSEGALQNAGVLGQQNAAANQYNQNIADHLASQYSYINGDRERIARLRDEAKSKLSIQLAQSKLNTGLLQQISKIAPADRPAFVARIVDPATGQPLFTDPDTIKAFSDMSPADLLKASQGGLYDAKTGEIVDPASARNQKLFSEAQRNRSVAEWKDAVTQYLPQDLQAKWKYWADSSNARNIAALAAQTNAQTNAATKPQALELQRQRLANSLSSADAATMRIAVANANKDIDSQIDDLQSQMKTRGDLNDTDPSGVDPKKTVRENLQSKIDALQQARKQSNSLDSILGTQHRIAITRDYQNNRKALQALPGAKPEDFRALDAAYQQQLRDAGL